MFVPRRGVICIHYFLGAMRAASFFAPKVYLITIIPFRAMKLPTNSARSDKAARQSLNHNNDNEGHNSDDDNDNGNDDEISGSSTGSSNEWALDYDTQPIRSYPTEFRARRHQIGHFSRIRGLFRYSTMSANASVVRQDENEVMLIDYVFYRAQIRDFERSVAQYPLLRPHIDELLGVDSPRGRSFFSDPGLSLIHI